LPSGSKFSGLGTGHRGLQKLRDVANAQAEIGDFVTVRPDLLLGMPASRLVCTSVMPGTPQSTAQRLPGKASRVASP
jgi:hypothetical protein